MKLLLLALQYPPLNIGGSFRPQRIASGLIEMGEEVTVITLNEEALSREFHNPLSVEVNHSVNIIRTDIDVAGTLENLHNTYYFSIVDTYGKRWKKHVIRAMDSLFSNGDKYDAMMVTGPPFSIARLGAHLSKKYNLPLVLDLRDAWSQWNIYPYASKVHYYLTKRLERKMLEYAQLVTVTSPQTRTDLLKVHPRIAPSKIHTLYNCFKEFFPKSEVEKSSNTEPIQVGYVGSFYYDPVAREKMFAKWYKKKPWQYFQFVPQQEDWLYKSPYFLFKALNVLFASKPSFRTKIKFNLVGQYPSWLPEMIEAFGLKDVVEIKTPIPHEDVPLFLMEQNYLLMTSSKILQGKTYMIAGKTYEYLATRKPILAFVAEGDQRQILEEAGNGIICDPDDIESCVKKLEQICLNTFNFSEENKSSEFMCTKQIEKFRLRLRELQTR